MMLEILLPAALGATVQAVIARGLDGLPGKSVRQVRQRLDSQSTKDAARAVRQAVESARQEMISDYWAEEDELSREVVAFLQRPSMAEEITRHLLFRGQPDFVRLRGVYLRGDDEPAASERWQALEGPLEVFFDAIEQHLEARWTTPPTQANTESGYHHSLAIFVRWRTQGQSWRIDN